jgi:hypothetical protein
VRSEFSAIRSSAIPPLPAAAHEYVAQRDLVAVVVWRDNRVGISRDPCGASQAWWCPANSAGMVVRRAETARVDIEEAAQKVGVKLIAHRTLLTHARFWSLGRAVANSATSRAVRW